MSSPAATPSASAADAARVWHRLPTAEAAAALASDLQSGLALEEAARRLREHGTNELAEKPRPTFLALLLDQFKNFLVIILVAAAVVSIVLGEYIDAGVIILIVILNAVIGVIQESKAEEALAALKKMAAPDARVVRGGETLVVPSRELVPGDLVLLEAGNFVPADLRLVETVNLRIEEASLTGESVPVEKDSAAGLEEKAPLGDRVTMAYGGTLATFGRGRGLVTDTGMQTQIGQIARMIQEEESGDSPLQKKLAQMGRWLGIAALAICAAVFLVGVLEGRDILEMFMTSVSLAIAAVPEGLPAIVTVCLALGMREMVRRHALVRKLPAVETLGSATVICTDKTGTLTQNQMTAGHLWADGELFEITGEGYQPKGEVQRGGSRAELREYGSVRLLLQAAMLASDARLELAEAEGGGERLWRMVGDPTEGALVVAAAKVDLHREAVEARFPRLAEIPFDSGRKLMTTIHGVPPASAIQGREAVPVGVSTPFVAFTKGAPDLILERCLSIESRGAARDLSPGDRQRILAANAELASRALRVLGVAYRPVAALPDRPSPAEVETGLTFLGLVGMIDPARPEAAAAIRTAHAAGLKVIMVTGDYKETAAAIGRNIGLIPAASAGDDASDVRPAGAISGAEIDSLSDSELADALETTRVFARVSPQHKVRIVDALKKMGHVVGMTGDGVNDAPALKRADIGIAMGITGTDVTKQAADMVLTDDNFASIISAIEQGRIIFSNIRRFVFFLLSCNLGEIGTIFLGTLVGWPVPLTAIQLLWVNLLTDGAPALALGMEKGEPGVMGRAPRPTGEPIVNRSMLLALGVQTAAITAVTLLAFWIGSTVFGGVQEARTMAFLVLSGCQLVRAYTSRSERASVFTIGLFSNRWMQYAAALSAVLTLAVIYIPGLNTVFNAAPMSAAQWAYAVPLLLVPAVADELTKLVLRFVEKRKARR